jgi:uncharacterized protein YydD (DUF2326 family)
MIHSVTADQGSFRTVYLKPGLNVILADRTKDSSQRDTRNGLGKSTLLEIIHFCLGSNPRQGESVLVPELENWTFTVQLDLVGSRFDVSRSTSDPRRVYVEGHTDLLPMRPTTEKSAGKAFYVQKDWNAVLGACMFGLPLDTPRKYAPSFRSLISFFARRTPDAYSTPFEHYRKQNEFDVQINNAFLLGLNWELAADLQLLKDRKKHLDNLRASIKEGTLTRYLGSIGDLEAKQVRLAQQIKSNEHGLATFNVLPQYRQVEERASELTRRMQEVRNGRAAAERKIGFYEESLSTESGASADQVSSLYAAAGVELPESVRRRLEDVTEFHSKVVRNRKEFLSTEVERLQLAVADWSAELEALNSERQELMNTLRTHGPWEEYQALTKAQAKLQAEYEDLRLRADTLREIQDGTSTYKIDRELILKSLRLDYAERQEQRNIAIEIFSSNSEYLYDAPGRLVIDVEDYGYKFNVDIERSGSRGIDSMKVFCYDLMLIELQSRRAQSPGFLFHDSIVFDGVDERQRALALQLAAMRSAEVGFQYICTLNSDMLPVQEFQPDFDIRGYTRLVLTDDEDEGALLGKRF